MTATLVVAWGPGELRAGLLEDGAVTELRIEREFSGSLVGTSFVGRIVKLQQALSAGFVDLGLGQPGFLPLSPRTKIGLTEGQGIVAEVVKDAHDNKPPEIKLCLDQSLATASGPVPRRLGPAKTAVDRLLNSLDDAILDRVVTNDAETLLELRRALSLTQPAHPVDCQLDRAGDLLAVYDIETAFAAALAPVLPLEGGGVLRIDQTNAATLIDVDLGAGSKTKDSAERALFAANLAATREIARQLRWRNLGGAIIVDFVTMRNRGHRQQVWDALAAATAADPLPVQLHGWTKLGHIELTRQRRRTALPDIVLDAARREPTPASLALQALARISAASPRPGPITLTVSAPVGEELAGPLARYLDIAAERCGRKITIVRQGVDTSTSVAIDGI